MTLKPCHHDLISSDRVYGLWHLNIWLCNLPILILHISQLILPSQWKKRHQMLLPRSLSNVKFPCIISLPAVQASVDTYPAKVHHFLTLWRQVIWQTISIFAAWFDVHSRGFCKTLREPVQMGKCNWDSPKWRELCIRHRAQQYAYKHVAGERILGYHEKKKGWSVITCMNPLVNIAVHYQ
jgi:hypothetical protein